MHKVENLSLDLYPNPRDDRAAGGTCSKGFTISGFIVFLLAFFYGAGGPMS